MVAKMGSKVNYKRVKLSKLIRINGDFLLRQAWAEGRARLDEGVSIILV